MKKKKGRKEKKKKKKKITYKKRYGAEKREKLGKKNTSFFAKMLTILDLEKNREKIEPSRLSMRTARPKRSPLVMPEPAAFRTAPLPLPPLTARAEGKKKNREGPRKKKFPPVGVPPEGDEPTGHEDESQ